MSGADPSDYEDQESYANANRDEVDDHVFASACPPNGGRLSCGAQKKDSFHNLRAPPASSAG